MLLRTLRKLPWRTSMLHTFELLDVVSGVETFLWMVLAYGRPTAGFAEHMEIIAPGRSHRVRIGISRPHPLSPQMRAGLEYQCREHGLLTYPTLDEFLAAKRPIQTGSQAGCGWEHSVPVVAMRASPPPSKVPDDPDLLAFLEYLLDPDKQCRHGCELCIEDEPVAWVSASWS